MYRNSTARISCCQTQYLMVTNQVDPAYIALEISHATMKRPQKIKNQKNQPLNFSKNKKLLESVHGARRTVMLKYLDVLGGVPANSVFFLWKIRAEFESATHM